MEKKENALESESGQGVQAEQSVWTDPNDADVPGGQVVSEESNGMDEQVESGGLNVSDESGKAPSKLADYAKDKRLLVAAGAVLLAVVITILNVTGTICLRHDWVSANCESPKKCLKCGREEGEIDSDNHDFGSATCTTPAQCWRCDTYKGGKDPYNHSWNAATCSAPATCSRCCKTKGEPAGHMYDSEGRCETCGVSQSSSQAQTAKEVESSESEDSSEIDPDFKAAMDSYEEFFDSYIEFMNKYVENPSDPSLLASYAEFMTQYTETMDEMESWDDGSLNDAEMAYYLEVTLRIEEKLLDVVI